MLTTPVAFYGENGRLAEIECLKNELGEPDASGRRKPVPVEGSNFRIPIDVAVIAIGQSASPLISRTTKDIETSKNGILVVDSEMRTSKDGVFAGGDVVTGGATVILAMGQAKIAAETIHKHLQKRNNGS
jgi:glutamate synthase (NADPH) small chain